MTDRIPLDDMTSDQLDALYERLNDAEKVIAHLEDGEKLRLRAETELAALRAVARGYCPACGRGDAAPTVEDWQRERDEHGRLEIANQALNTAALEAVERAERAEAELAATIDSMETVLRRARRAEAEIAACRRQQWPQLVAHLAAALANTYDLTIDEVLTEAHTAITERNTTP